MQFIQLSSPPREVGTMCSRVRSSTWKWPTQYAQTWRSRANSFGLLSAGERRQARLGTAPRTAMIGCTSIFDCRPVRRWVPPRSTWNASPSVHATPSLA